MTVGNMLNFFKAKLTGLIKLPIQVVLLFKRIIHHLHNKPKRHELEFLPAAVEVMATPPPLLARSILWFILFVFLFGILWAYFGEVEQIVSAQGKLIPSGQTKMIRAYDRSIVKSILVKEGQFVQASQTLMLFEGVESEVDYTQLLNNIESLKKSITRIHYFLKLLNEFKKDNNLFTSILHFKSHYQAIIPSAYQKSEQGQILINKLGSFASVQMEIYIQREDLKEQFKQFKIEAKKLQDLHQIHQQDFLEAKNLHAQRFLTTEAFNRSRTAMLESENEIKKNQSNILFSKQKINDLLEKARLTFFSERNQTLDEKEKFKKELNSQQDELARYLNRLEKQKLRAPIAGYVFNLKITAPNISIQPGEEIMIIVPQVGLQVEAMVLNKDVGFLSIGDHTQLKIESYPYTRYGFAKGKVVDISADATVHEQLGNVYKVFIDVTENKIIKNGKSVQLLPGMNVTIELDQGKRTLLEYFLSPFLKETKEAFRENG